MKINEKRLLDRLNQIGQVGKTPSGICREGFTETYFKGVETLRALMEEVGLDVRVDPVGNVFGRLAGKHPEAAPLLVGSHLDTVKNGGLYDGVLGVTAALECAAVLKEANICLEQDLEIAAFNAEEGGLLGGTFGSRAAAGNQSLKLDGIDEKLSAYGLTRDSVGDAVMERTPKVYLELHIEQGIQLYQEGLEIGIVEGIVGITRYRIVVKGEANHGGTTPMGHRKDALVGASQLILFINRLANQKKSPFVATVGKIEVIPNSVNVIAGQVELILELREMEKAVIDSFVDQVKTEAKKLQDYRIAFEPYSHKGSVYLDKSLAGQIEGLCKEKDISCKRMYSGAGHDAMEMAKITRTALIFIPSKDGISHSPNEYSSDEDVARGAQLLLDVLGEV